MRAAIPGTVIACLIALFLLATLIEAQEADPTRRVLVANAEEFNEAISQAGPGTWVLLAPGEYPGGFAFKGLQGAPDRPIVIGAQDPDDPPVIRGGRAGIHLVDPAFVVLQDLRFTGATGNGLNIDDGGSYETPAHDILLQRLTVTDVGPEGNRDGIKLSGVDDFRVASSRIERWGTGGSAIDIVGGHRGTIEGNLFRHVQVQGGSGVQMKGGSREITVRRNRFEDAGSRAINIGGSTDFPYFRPPIRPDEEGEADLAEAADILVEGNTFIGSATPIAFVGVDGAIVRFNTFYRPRRWALRILQETRHPRFVPSRNGDFTDNIVVFRSDEWASGGVNIGPATAPETFRFARNWWFCLDDPARSRPDLPTTERDGHYGEDPRLRDPAKGDLRLAPDSPATGAGADASTR